MNKVELVGRLTRDPEVRYTQGENASAIARFSVAVNRRFKNNEGNYDADFINCVAFSKSAEFIEKYFKKGMAIGISGASAPSNAPANNNAPSADGFMNIPDGIDEELPFN